MDHENRKLFIGGISRGTDEQRLKDYFSKHGEVMEAVIMRDRSTGRARGFGFVVFRDLSDAERVIKEKHIIDGRIVEAKKAVPRDDQNILNLNFSSIHVPASPGHNARKIFVGGLPSCITESSFKNYFDQFGTITDVVVMYDHRTQRPRGFGFITFDSEEAVYMVLHKTFHELNGKLVEVKRAVPKERSPVPNGNPFQGKNDNCYELNWSSSFDNKFGNGCNLRSVGGGNGRSGIYAFGASGYDEVMPNRFAAPIGQITGRTESFFALNGKDIWESGGALTNPTNLGTFLSFPGENMGEWEASRRSREAVTGYNSTGRQNGSNGYMPESDGYGRKSRWGVAERSLTVLGSNQFKSKVGGIYGSNSAYTNFNWQFELDNLSGIPF